MIYTPNMVRILVFAVPFAAVAGLVLLLNGLGAEPGIAVAAFGLLAVLIGSSIGYFANRLPELRRTRQPHCLASIHHSD